MEKNLGGHMHGYGYGSGIEIGILSKPTWIAFLNESALVSSTLQIKP